MAKQIWQQLKIKNILKPRNNNKKTKILLRNAIIRSTLTYALQTNQASEKHTQKLEQFMYKNKKTNR